MTYPHMPSRAQTVEAIVLTRQALDAAAIQVTASGGPRRGLFITLPSTLDDSDVRITWDKPYAFVVEDSHASLTWSVVDARTGRFDGVAVIDDDARTIQIGDLGTVTVQITRFGSSRVLKQARERLGRAARDARWQLLMALEPMVTRFVQQASLEIAGDTGHVEQIVANVSKPIGMLNFDELSALVSELLLGRDGSDGSIAINMLQRLAERHDTLAVDVRTYLARNLKSAATSAVRRQVGDPKIGPMVRRLAARQENTDVMSLVRELRTRFPSEHIGVKRVRAALNVAASPHMNALSLHELEADGVDDGGVYTRSGLMSSAA